MSGTDALTPCAKRPYRLGFWKGMFFLLVAVGLVATVVRMVSGLGSVTNLSDKYPWGLWKGFNVLVAIGLGGAGFTIMGTVYVFNAKRFHSIVRPTVLMAFLAYLSAAISLAIDIGRPWTIWHPLVMWNPHSVLFEVAWCLMLYTCVLTLEGSGMLFERWGWNRLVRAQRMITLPIVIVGVILSTLHQSSLGALFLIVPGKLHALWYSEMLPLLFFVSAMAMGLAMVIILSRLSARAFGRALEVPILAHLARVLLAVLWVYGVARLFDMAHNGSLPLAFQATYEAALFQCEIMLGVAIPILLLASPARRARSNVLYTAAVLVVFGFVLNRLNVSITGFEAAQGGHYVPAWPEVFVTLMIVAMVFGAFAFGARYLNVYPEMKKSGEQHPPETARIPAPSDEPAWQNRLPPLESVRRN
jgi:Ni/Fe-hydrogenase subunit HybB-like protein